VDDEPEPRLPPETEGDPIPGRAPPAPKLPKRQPSLGAGNIQHPLPDFSGQDAAKISRALADEREELEEQLARGTPDQPAQDSDRPSSVTLAFPPAQQSAKAARLWGTRPWKGPAAEPSWHVLGTMAGRQTGGGGGALGLMSLAGRLSGGPAAGTQAKPGQFGTDLARQGGEADASGADLARQGTETEVSGADITQEGAVETSGADLAQSEPETADADPAEAAPPAEADAAPAAPADPAVAAVQQTFALVKAAGDDAAAYFYGWLFAGHPQLRDLFPSAMNEQRDRLFRALGRIVGNMSSPEDLATYLGQLGRDHRKYSVQPEMYDAVGDALMAALRSYAGPTFIPAAEEAWAQAYKAVSSLMIEAANEDSLTAPPFWTAEVVENEQRRPGISILTVSPYLPLPYEPGQHITVQTPRWPKVWRPYSVACRPREDGLMTFHVKAVPGGWVSNALVHHTEPGTEIILGPALGTMTLRPAGGRDLLCVAGGTGLSPIKAIIEEAIRESTACPRQIHLFYGARTRDELYDLPDLWRLADAYQGFQLTPVTSDDPAFDGMQGNVGRVAARYLPHRECEAYVAGPPAMVGETVRVLAKSGLPRERIHYDDTLLADGEQLS
jgi:NAD(P)H-flavin reductase/hemoglobin-like flavoprotein